METQKVMLNAVKTDIEHRELTNKLQNDAEFIEKHKNTLVISVEGYILFGEGLGNYPSSIINHKIGEKCIADVDKNHKNEIDDLLLQLTAKNDTITNMSREIEGLEQHLEGQEALMKKEVELAQQELKKQKDNNTVLYIQNERLSAQVQVLGNVHSMTFVNTVKATEPGDVLTMQDINNCGGK